MTAFSATPGGKAPPPRDRWLASRPATGGVAVRSRLLAFGVDYLLVAAYLAMLLGISLLLLASPARNVYAALWSGAVGGELMGFGVLTVPVVLYFALSESLGGATLGKRVCGLRVVNSHGGALSVPRSIVRSGVKFLPWELAHFTIWHYAASEGGPPEWTGPTLGLVYALVALYLVTMVAGPSHRTVYDWIAGSRVDLK